MKSYRVWWISTTLLGCLVLNEYHSQREQLAALQASSRRSCTREGGCHRPAHRAALVHRPALRRDLRRDREITDAYPTRTRGCEVRL